MISSQTGSALTERRPAMIPENTDMGKDALARFVLSLWYHGAAMMRRGRRGSPHERHRRGGRMANYTGTVPSAVVDPLPRGRARWGLAAALCVSLAGAGC